MTFNKHFPDRPETATKGLTPLQRARLFRIATWASLLMLVTGYVILFVLWD